jgi:hypothetical protein
MLCLWSDESVFMDVFMVFNLWISPDLSLSLVANF